MASDGLIFTHGCEDDDFTGHVKSQHSVDFDYSRYIWKLMSLNIWRSITVTSNERHVVSNHRPFDCLFNSLIGTHIKETLKPALLALCEGNSPVTSEFPAQRASNAETASIWWRHHTQPLYNDTVNTSISAPNPKTLNVSRLVLLLCPIHWSLVSSREWSCSWSSADRRCSNYIWVITELLYCLIRCVL